MKKNSYLICLRDSDGDCKDIKLLIITTRALEEVYKIIDHSIARYYKNDLEEDGEDLFDYIYETLDKNHIHYEIKKYDEIIEY